MRNYKIDAAKGIAILAVVTIHAAVRLKDTGTFFTYYWYRPLLDLAVPFFFIVSGYFNATKNKEHLLPRALNIFKVFIGFSFFYFIVDIASISMEYFILNESFVTAFNELISGITPYNVLNGRVGNYHLWFLMSLIFSLLLLYLLRRMTESSSVILLIGALLLVVSLINPIRENELMMYGGVPEAFFYVSAGHYISKNEVTLPKKRSLVYMSVFLTGFAFANYLPVYSVFLVKLTEGLFISHSLIFLINGRPGKSSILSKIGMESLKIYILHVFIIEIYGLLERLSGMDFISNLYLEVVFLVVISTFLSIYLYKIAHNAFVGPINQLFEDTLKK